jgi:hypothetical protein
MGDEKVYKRRNKNILDSDILFHRPFQKGKILKWKT